ncbi:response regulator [Dyadobacter endophyticus]|uniref:response regulator n=1 Tax=Dyadobacter endophyticus TaxID=1749036 RepID=UPI00166686B0
MKVVATYTKSRDSVQTVLDYRPDLVFLDIEMPQMNGFQVMGTATVTQAQLNNIHRSGSRNSCK